MEYGKVTVIFFNCNFSNRILINEIIKDSVSRNKFITHYNHNII